MARRSRTSEFVRHGPGHALEQRQRGGQVVLRQAGEREARLGIDRGTIALEGAFEMEARLLNVPEAPVAPAEEGVHPDVGRVEGVGAPQVRLGLRHVAGAIGLEPALVVRRDTRRGALLPGPKGNKAAHDEEHEQDPRAPGEQGVHPGAGLWCHQDFKRYFSNARENIVHLRDEEARPDDEGVRCLGHADERRVHLAES